MKKRILLVFVAAFFAVTSAISQTREIQLYKGGSLVQSFPISSVDSVKVGYSYGAPESVTAQLTNKKIVVSWSAVTGAQSYQVYRSGDNSNYTMLASNITATTYTDNSPLPGKNYYKVKTMAAGTMSALSESTGTATMTSSGLESGLYLGVMSFNQILSSQPISILNAATKPTFNSFIDAMTMKNGTLLCYSMDQAINALQEATLPEDIFNVAIVTFTDGLDQGSLMIDDRFDSDDEFLVAIKQRITSETISGQAITAYSIGLRGSDITSASDIAKFQSTLKQLASSDDKATEVTNMAEVNAKFQEIAEQLNSTSYLQTISLKIPGLSNGTRIRFTFDNAAVASNSEVYIEGTFNLHSRSLTDVEYHGMTSTSGTTISGTAEGIFVTFKFEGIKTENGKLLSSEYIDEWYLTSSNSWQVNSEFDKDENSDVLYEKKSAVIMLVLDCSSSLGSEFSTMQSNAKSFIGTLCQSTEEEGGNNGDNTLYSTKPLDLSLAVVWDGVRYYLTQEEYAKANLSRATIEGVTVISNTDTFIVALEDAHQAGSVTWDIANIYWGDLLPTESQGKIISARWSYINNAINAFGGTAMDGSRWLNCKNTSGYGCFTYNNGGSIGSLNPIYSETEHNIRPVKALTDDLSVPVVWKDDYDLLLAVEKDSERTYLTVDEYKAKSDIADYNILGVVVAYGIYPSNRFIIALNDEPYDPMYWSLANELYPDNLPTENQGIIISAYWGYINQAIKAFGGTEMDGRRWLNCKNTSGYGCYTYSGDGSIGSMNYNNSDTKCKVRLVYPF